MILSNLSDAELLQALRKGRQGALGVLYDRYGALVYRLGARVLGNLEEAEDLTQEIFSSLVNKAYNPERGSLRAYLTVLTRSRAIDRLRKLRSRHDVLKRLEHISPTYTPAQEMDDSYLSHRVITALQQLPDTHRQVLEMAYYSGMSQSEISEHLELPLGTVKSRARSGLIQLKRLLEDLREQ